MPTPQKTVQKIREFVDLSQGWHFGEGIPSSQENLRRAQALLVKSEELGFDTTDAFPGIEGEIQIVIYREDTDYEFTVENDGTITFIHDENDKELRYEPNLSLEDAIETLDRLSDKAWLFSGSFTASTMIRTANDSVAWPFATLVTGRAYQSLKACALNIPAAQFASISPDFTLTWPVIPLSIGRYLKMRYLLGVSSNKRTVNLETNAITTFKDGQTQMPDIDLSLCV